MYEEEMAVLEQARELLLSGRAEEAFALLQSVKQEASEIFLSQEGWRLHELFGACFQGFGDAEGAAQAYFQAAQADAILRSQREHFSSYLFALHYLSGLGERELAEQHFTYGRLYDEGLALPPRRLQRKERIRVGYLAPSFREQSAARFYECLLTDYDRELFEVCAYALEASEDTFSASLQEKVSLWRDLAGVNLEQAAWRIREDDVDILVDLGGHSAGGLTLMILGYQPAPIQVCGIGWFDTTGMGQVDYLWGDDSLRPSEPSLLVEQLLELPQAFCYVPGEDLRRFRRQGRNREESVVFGCFNNFMKISDELLASWLRILQRLPEAHLLLQDTMPIPARKSHMERRLAEKGFPMERVEVRLGAADYVQAFQEIDIMLDTWPYPGGGMTCGALYCGVPVIALRGERYSARFADSLLTAAGLEEFLAQDRAEYERLAVDLAGDRARLAGLQQGLRAHLEASPLLDRAGYMAGVEQTYRQIYEEAVKREDIL